MWGAGSGAWREWWEDGGAAAEARGLLCHPIKKKVSPSSQKGWLGSGLFNECFSSFGRAPHACAGRGEEEVGEGASIPD